MKKILCVLTAVLMLLCCLLPAAAAAETGCSCGKAPIVTVLGIGNKIVDESGTVFPPQGKTIAATVFTALPLLPGLLGGSLNARQQERAFNAAAKIFSPIAFDKNGDPATPAAGRFTYPAEIPHGHGEAVSFDYDWRLDPFTVAAQLNDFIHYVEEKTGHDSVYLVGESMGTMIMDTYLAAYGFDEVEGVVWFNGAYRGVATCSESFSNQNSFSAESFSAYLLQQAGVFGNSPLLCDLLTGLYESGLFENVLGSAVSVSEQLANDGMLTRFMYSYLGRIPGFWGLVSAEDYAAARDFVFPTPELREEYAGLLARLDRFHNEVAARTDEIMAQAKEATGKVGVICGSGEVIVPVTKDNSRQSDSVILTEAASNGATCAPLGESFGADYTQKVDDGHNHISPDRTIDASTAFFPDNTWFVKYGHHDMFLGGFADALIQKIFFTEGFDVFTDENFPQFLVRDPKTGTVQPLTPDNGGVETPAPGFAAKLFKALFKGLNVFVKAAKCLTALTGKFGKG